ncbi:hypothetical protein EAY16_23990 [Vibrio anguillarum]|nr:hypothetical protein [Vibrio anguillarum]
MFHRIANAFYSISFRKMMLAIEKKSTIMSALRKRYLAIVIVQGIKCIVDKLNKPRLISTNCAIFWGFKIHWLEF